MEALKQLIENNHTFAQDVYVAFAGDEEIRGGGADVIVDELGRRGIVPGLVLDEGGAVVENSFPGVKHPMAVIGTAEKGFMSVQLTAHDQGGHASTPKADTAVTVLAEAVTRLNRKHLFPIQRNVVMDQMFDTLGRHAGSFVLRLVFANLWLTFPLIRLLAKKQGGQFAAMLRTTQAFTMMEGSEAINVLPSKATVGINYRISLREDAIKIERKLKKALKDLPVEVTVEYATDPTPASLTDATYDKLTRTIRKVWPNAIPSPYLMMAATDARYHHRMSDHVYRFSPMALTSSEFAMIHGENESIQIEHLFTMVRFYIELIQDFS
jgi:carboxypeptidase PM20D1